MRFSICLLEPEGYKYSHFLYDVCKYFCYTIEAAGYHCCMIKNHLYSDRINIIMGAHNLKDLASVEQIKRSGRYIIIQSEVLRDGGIAGWPDQETFQTIYVPLMRHALSVWDGVESNHIHLRKIGIVAEGGLTQFGYLRAMEEITHKKNKDIDFLYYGSLTPHRKQLIQELKAFGGNVVCVFDEAAIFRNDLIARTRVNLAPNQAPGINHLTSKVLYLLNNRSVVVVERCCNQDWVEHCFPFADTEKWAALCMETLNHPDLDQFACENYERYKKLDMVDLIRPLIDKLCADQKVSCDIETSINTELLKHPDSAAPREDLLFRHFKQENFVPGITSIVFLTFNQLQYTKKCVKSLRKHTPEPHEIVFVDHGSTDGTVKWLKKLVQENDNFQLIENQEIFGFAKGCNQGIEATRGEFILLLNNDVVVAKGWLSGMLECLNGALDAGVVGPMTNEIGGRQQVTSDEYRSVDYLEKFAEKFRKKYRHRRILHRTIADFCMLFKRTLAERIGLLDESFGTGNFEEDFCLRAALEGFRNYIAGDVFVHHFGRESILGNEMDHSPTISGNRKIFEKKWTLSTQNPFWKKLAILRATEMAAELYHQGSTDKAVEVLINCIKISPDAKDIYHELARMFIESKRFDEAFQVLESMPESAKNDLKGLECAGYIKEGLGLDGDADTYAEMMLSLDQSYAPAINLKGVLAYKKGNQEQAEYYFKKALEFDPSYGEAHTNLGVLRWTTGKVDEALAYLSKGFILSPTVPDHSTLYYSAVSSSGTYGDAEALFRAAKRLYPNNKNIVFLHIDTLIQQEKFSIAIDEIEDAIIAFGLQDGILNAALSVREKVGPRRLEQKGLRKTSLSLSMIVKNEEEHVSNCLRSVRQVVDEMIVVDTGSTDRTKEVARAFGAQVFEFPWTGDFSEARNHSLSKANGDWILILDADEVLSPLDFKELTGIIGMNTPSPDAYSIITRNYINNVSSLGWTQNTGQYPEEAGLGWVPTPKVRLFRKRRDVFFSNPVHELLEPSIKKAGIPIYSCGVVVHHYGKLLGEREQKKAENYYLLGKIKLENEPSNPKFIQELARQAYGLRNYEEAVELLLQLIDFMKTNPEETVYNQLSTLTETNPYIETYMELASAYLALDRYTEALSASRKAIENAPTLKEAVQTYANCEIIAGSVDKASAPLLRLIETTPDYPPALLLLAVVYCIQGEVDKMRELFKTLLHRGFKYTSGLNRIARQLRINGRNNDSILILNAMIENKISDQETIDLLEMVSKPMQS